jgi:hypothetical protein
MIRETPDGRVFSHWLWRAEVKIGSRGTAEMDNFHWSRQKSYAEPEFLGQSRVSDLPRRTSRRAFCMIVTNFLPAGVNQRTALTK